MKTKDLMLNGILLARYQFKENMLWIKLYKDLTGNVPSDEILVTQLIQIVEDRMFLMVSYLNI